MKGALLFAILAIVANKVSLAEKVSLRATSDGWNYDRCDVVNGPGNWPLLCETAEDQQSPIDLCGAKAFPDEKDASLDFSYAASVAMELKSDGQAQLSKTDAETEMTLNAHDIPRIVGRQKSGDDITWKFAQAHFHWGRDGRTDEGSEHYVEGVQHPLEIHFVHFNSDKYTDLGDALAKGEDDALLVVGQLFKTDETASTTPTSFQAVSAALFSDTAAIAVNPLELIDQSGGFYSYAGSLTTPTCNPVVTWVVMSKVIGIPRSALDSFHDKTTEIPDTRLVSRFGNFRPLQPRGGRTVYMTNGGTTLACNAEGAREPVFPCGDECIGQDVRSVAVSSVDEAVASRRDSAAEPVSLAKIFESRRAGGDYSWDRCDAAKGPSGWATAVADSQCNAGQQSPIDLCGGIPLPLDRAIALTFDYPAEEISLKLKTEAEAYLSTDGTETATLNAHDIPRIVGRQDDAETTDITWKFAQAHFHWGRNGRTDEGSEHYIEGVQHPLEIHFVHFNSNKYTDLGDALASGNKDALLVVGQMFTVEDAVSSRSTEKHAVGAPVAAARRASGSSWNWDRCDAVNGPANWPSDDGSFCNAEEQSPIDLCGAEAFPADMATELSFNYPAEDVAMELKSDGQAQLSKTDAETEMTLNAHDIPRIVGRQKSGDDITWKFAQAHFHWGRNGRTDEGSEHYIEGVQHPLEIHFVHFNSDKYTDLGDALASGNKDALLVVGQFFEVGDSMSAEMTEITNAFDSASPTNNRFNINLKPLELIDQSGGFYSYAGSLTTPTCNPVVTWVVMSKVMTITEAGLNSFQDNIVTTTGELVDYGNFRPLQPRGGRTVYMTAGVKTLPCNPYGAREPEFSCAADCGGYSDSTTAIHAIVSGLAQASTAASEVDINLKLSELIDPSGGFYTYAGSLTTPTCNPVVTWVVMSKVMTIPRSALDLFHDKTLDSKGQKVSFGNFRPLQDRDGRNVFVSKGVTTLACNAEGAREPTFPCDDGCDEINSNTESNDDESDEEEDKETSGESKTKAVGAPVAAARRASGSSWNWDRCDAVNGPANWPSDDGSFCNAEEQSPIDLCGAEAFPADMATELSFNYPAEDVAMELKSDGQAQLSKTDAETEMTLNAHDIPRIVGRQKSGDDITWKFAQAHFHWGRNGRTDEGSEHYIEGVQHPLEIHFVHFNSDKYTDLGDALASGNKDALVVVGQFFEVGDSMSAAMTEITNAFDSASPTNNRFNINLKPLELIDQSGGFYSYAGSLTTPTCNPVVTWVVMSKVMTITEAGLNSFQDNIVTTTGELVDYGNFRPLQPRGGRTVYMTAGVKTLPCNPYGAREPEFSCAADCGDYYTYAKANVATDNTLESTQAGSDKAFSSSHNNMMISVGAGGALGLVLIALVAWKSVKMCRTPTAPLLEVVSTVAEDVNEVSSKSSMDEKIRIESVLLQPQIDSKFILQPPEAAN